MVDRHPGRTEKVMPGKLDKTHIIIDFDIFLTDTASVRHYLGRYSIETDTELIQDRPSWFSGQPVIARPLRLHPVMNADPQIRAGDGSLDIQCVMRPKTIDVGEIDC